MAAAEKLTAKDVKPFYSLSNFFNTIFSESTSETQIAAAEATEKQKAANHLEFSRNQFAVFFDVTNHIYICILTALLSFYVSA